MGKEPEKEWIYVDVYLNHFAAHLKLIQHCKSTIFQYKIKIKTKTMQAKSQRCDTFEVLKEKDSTQNPIPWKNTF